MEAADVQEQAGPAGTTDDPVAALAGGFGAVTALVQTTLARGDDDEVFELIVRVDGALADATEFARSLERLVAAGQPGEVVESDLRRLGETLERERAALAAQRSDLARLSAMRGQIEQEAQESEQLRAQVAELRRLEGLSAKLKELRAARESLEEASDAISAGRDAETLLATATARTAELLVASGETLDNEISARMADVEAGRAALTTRNEELASACDDIARDEAEVELVAAEVESAKERHAIVRERLQGLTAEWNLHLEADRQIAAMVGPTGGVEMVSDTSASDAAHPLQTLAAKISADLRRFDDLLAALIMAGGDRERREHAKRPAGRPADAQTTDTAANGGA